MLFRLEPRGHRSTFWVYASPLLALALTLIASALVFEAMGRSPGLALYTFFIKPLTSPSSLPELLVKASPLILIGTGLSLGFRANVWNIGAEGQYTMGALAGGGLALLFYDSTSPLLTGLMSGKSPLNVRQLLLVNLLTDMLPAVALASRPPSGVTREELLHEGPERSLGSALTRDIAVRAGATAGAAVTAWTFGRMSGTREQADTIGLVALVGTQLAQTIVAGGRDPVVQFGVKPRTLISRTACWWATLLTMVAESTAGCSTIARSELIPGLPAAEQIPQFFTTAR